jgi:chromosome segregation ATPase
VVNKESETIDSQIERSSVKEHEIMIVTGLIDEKARLNDEKAQLRKTCRDEKAKLEQELERMRKRREEMEREEAAEILRQIDAEFDQEHNKLLEQRKQIADVNRNITVIQRRMENCPSKIEITQFHKRLVELFDNLNLKSEENRRYVNLYNTVMETRRLFRQQTDYMKEINDSYKSCKQKKEKEVLLHNIQNVLKIIDQSISQSTESLNKLRVDSQRVQAQYNESIMREKDHFRRIKEFEDECDKNDELRSKLKK